MKKASAIISFLCLSLLTAYAQLPFPRNAAEDTNGVMSDAYWSIWNPELQERIDADIDRYRKADATIQIEGVRPGTEVKVEQLTHAFYFGAQMFNYNQLGKKEYNDRYKDLFGTLFNSATVAFYWRNFENEQGRTRFYKEYWDEEEWWNNCQNPKAQMHWRRPATDDVVDYCLSRGVRVHGHTLCWGSRKQFPRWQMYNSLTPGEEEAMKRILPDYGVQRTYTYTDVFTKEYDSLSVADLEKMFPHYAVALDSLITDRIKKIALHYGDRIKSWDIVNESSTDFQKGALVEGSLIAKSQYGIMPGDYAYKAFRTAETYFPESVQLNINEYNIGQTYLDEVESLRSRGCKIDVMGSQMHLFNPKQCLDIAAGAEIQTPEYIYGWHSRLARAGLPIHLSEITITSPGNDERGFQIQAVITRNLYRLWFSLEKMNGITWWNLVDDCGALDETTISGIFTRDMQPKPAYFALDDLINHEWKTELSVKASKDGSISFRGFKGNYRISWTDRKGREHVQEYELQ